MKQASLRFSGGLTWSADWSDPSRPPEIHLLDPPPRLNVPIEFADAVGDAPHTRPAGQTVRRGEGLTADQPLSSAAVLAPVNGRIVGQSTALLTNGRTVHSIELETDFDDPALHHDPFEAVAGAPDADSKADPGSESPVKPSLTHFIESCRIAGMNARRVASPDLMGQLLAAMTNPPDSVICLMLDADPPLRPAALIGRRLAHLVTAGVKALADAVDARRRCIVVDASAPRGWWSNLERDAGSAISVLAMPHRYPQTDPSLAIDSLLGRRCRPGRLPTDARAIVIDAATALALGRLSLQRAPMLESMLAIRDHATGRSSYLLAPIGIPLRHVLHRLQLSHGEVDLRIGDLMRDMAADAQTVISAGENTLHVLPRRQRVVPDPCIRCGWCYEACPTRVQPAGLLEAAQQFDAALAAHHGLDGCIECGVCSEVCPSRLPLLPAIRGLRNKLGATTAALPVSRG